jgi:acetyl/propionyl-CoA carboxylase alpha subunit
MKLRHAGLSPDHDVEIIDHQDGIVRARIDGREISARFELQGPNDGIIQIEGSRFHIGSARRKDAILVTVGPRTFDFMRLEDGAKRHARGLAASEITAPMPGKVLSVMVKAGDAVVAGQPLVVIEAMKMETTLAAESDAIVKRVAVSAGEMVDHGAVLVELSPLPASPSAPESDSPAS